MRDYSKKYFNHNYKSNQCLRTYGKNIMVNETQNDFSQNIRHQENYYGDWLTLTAHGRDAGSAGCSFIERDFTFTVQNISLVKELSIAQLSFNGYLQV